MTTPRSPRPTGAPGVRHLLTAASLAATLSGWALFTAAQPPQASATLQAPAAAVAAPPPGWLSAPPPLPTLVTVATVDAPAAPVAAPAAPVAAPLRQLSAPPPAPVTTTRSSR
jgi:hypothetical protein